MPEEATIKAPSKRLVAFLDALEEAPDDEYCSPPGLFGLYRARWIRKGMKAGALMIHHSGRGLALSAVPVGGDPRKVTLTEIARRWETAMRLEDEQDPAGPAFTAKNFLRVEQPTLLLLTDGGDA